MPILGVILRTRPEDAATVAARLRTVAGVELAATPLDGRLVLVIEAAEAAATLGVLTQWPEVQNAALVYEYSGPDSPPPPGSDSLDYRSWRDSLAPATAAN